MTVYTWPALIAGQRAQRHPGRASPVSGASSDTRTANARNAISYPGSCTDRSRSPGSQFPRGPIRACASCPASPITRRYCETVSHSANGVSGRSKPAATVSGRRAPVRGEARAPRRALPRSATRCRRSATRSRRMAASSRASAAPPSASRDVPRCRSRRAAPRPRPRREARRPGGTARCGSPSAT